MNQAHDDRLGLYRSALEQSERLMESGQPVSHRALSSIIEQLRYLIALETGTCLDASRVAHLNIGRLTVREVEELGYLDLAEILYRVDAVARTR